MVVFKRRVKFIVITWFGALIDSQISRSPTRDQYLSKALLFIHSFRKSFSHYSFGTLYTTVGILLIYWVLLLFSWLKLESAGMCSVSILTKWLTGRQWLAWERGAEEYNRLCDGCTRVLNLNTLLCVTITKFQNRMSMFPFLCNILRYVILYRISVLSSILAVF